MNRTIVIPGPETVIWWGVQVPVLAALFGVAGVALGHMMAPISSPPLPLQRQASVIAAGVLLSVGITIATGQRPLVVLGWSIGIGFSGITIFQTIAAQTRGAMRTLGERVAERLTAKRVDPVFDDPAPGPAVSDPTDEGPRA
jgi:hypothetical protein